MTKRLYIGLIGLMSFSLIGIIGLQVYWITESIKVKEDQFSQLIIQSLKSVSNELEAIDQRNFVERYLKSLKERKVDLEKSENLLRGIENSKKNSIIDKDKIAFDTEFSKIKYDINRTDLLKTQVIISNISVQHKLSKLDSDLQNIFILGDSISNFQLAIMHDKYMSLGDKMSIRKRVSKETLERLISVNLSLHNINTRFEYAIMSNGLKTSVNSKRFFQKGNEYVVPIFANSDGISNYNLFVQFPNKRDFVLSRMLLMLVFSVLFTLIIVFAYAGALFLIFKHRRTSEVKTDFINNMTHELKTPIATINLSIDAIRNPKILSDTDKILYYAGVIKEENKRMHDQIENVLRISRLDRNRLELSSEKSSLNEIVEEAIEHILLIVEDKGGTVDFDLDAENDIINVDPLHFSSVIINILDNANKYTEGSPLISVRTYNEENNVVVAVSDKGMGISKAAQDKIFDKFYRVSKGNVHNIKGQGLGLAYVKQIVEAHNGIVTVESKKGKGSIFKLKIPIAK